MRYETPAAFRQALLARIRQKADAQGVTVERLRKRVVFERMLARLIQAAPDRWALKGALALDFRLPERARATKDADLVTEADIERLTEDLLTATRVDLGDNFSFRIRRGGTPDLEAPEPTVRFHVTAEVAGQLFDEATIDVVVDARREWEPQIVRSHLLDFADLPPVLIPAIPPEAHVAEKLHAYTRSYGARAQPSTRAKDLVDLVVIVGTLALDAVQLGAACERVFARRNTHPLPNALPPPPSRWARTYRATAAVVQIDPNVAVGHQKAAACLDPVLTGKVTSGRWDPADRRWKN